MTGKTYDLLIIGGGLAGTALAYSLARQGAAVLLVEANAICSGTSAACAGRAQIIESETDEYLGLVLKGFPRLEGLSDELGIDLEWEMPGHFTLLSDEKEWKQYQYLVQRLKCRGVEADLLDLPTLQNAEPNLHLSNYLGAAFSKEGHLNPFKLCAGFSRTARRLGATLLSQTPVTDFACTSSHIVAVKSGIEEYSAGTILLATGAWTSKLANKAGCSLPVRFTHAEAIVSEPLPKVIHHHIGVSGFYETVHGSARRVTLGFGQHQNGAMVISNAIQPADEIDRASTLWGMPAIACQLHGLLPIVKNARIIRSWAAPSPFTPDYLPVIGWAPGFDNLYVAAGFHLAIPTIPLLSEAIASSILGLEDPIQANIIKAFSPQRFTPDINRLAEIKPKFN
jgi:glycine/D-amino acid oxidase-like deaminating enzyme